MKSIGLILKNTREDLDLTQIDVMRLTGINNKTLSGYENGISEPDLETFAKLLNLYGLSADDLLDIKSEKAVVNISCTEQETKLINCFRKLNGERQNDMLTVIEALSNK